MRDVTTEVAPKQVFGCVSLDVRWTPGGLDDGSYSVLLGEQPDRRSECQPDLLAIRRGVNPRSASGFADSARAVENVDCPWVRNSRGAVSSGVRLADDPRSARRSISDRRRSSPAVTEVRLRRSDSARRREASM